MRETHTLAVCENGHIIEYRREATSRDESASGQFNISLDIANILPGIDYQSHCLECGAKVLSTCPDCDHPIEAANQNISGDKSDLPNFCAGCGTDFSWTSEIESEVSRDGSFIDIDETEVDGQFYPDLIYEINLSYRVQADHATLILNRKLIESLLTDILKAEFGYENVEMFFDIENSQFYGLKELIKQFKVLC